LRYRQIKTVVNARWRLKDLYKDVKEQNGQVIHLEDAQSDSEGGRCVVLVFNKNLMIGKERTKPQQ